jgi:hypothetical protein
MPSRRPSENFPSTHSGELTLGTWLLQRPTHREIMAPSSTAGTHPLFSYILRTRSLPCPELAPCLEHPRAPSPYSLSPPPVHLHYQHTTGATRTSENSVPANFGEFMRFLRFLRNDLSVKTSDWWGRWLDQVNAVHAQSKSSSKLLSLCSTQRNNEALRQTPTMGRETLMCRRSRKPPPESENRVHLQPHHVQLGKKRNKSNKEPVWRSSTGASGLLKMTAWRIELAPFPHSSNVGYPPQKLSSPSQSLYMDMAMVMMPKKGVPSHV